MSSYQQQSFVRLLMPVCMEIWQSVQLMPMNSRSMVRRLTWQIMLQHIVLVHWWSKGFSISLAWTRSMRLCGDVQRWIQHGKHWWSTWCLHHIFGCRILPDLTLEIKFWGSWRVLWMEVCLSLVVPNGSLVMIQKARNSMQEYSRITSWLRPL